MIGAITGDLAAWTYENDREAFWSSLVSHNAILSSLGQVAYDTAMLLLDGNREVPAALVDYASANGQPLLHRERAIQVCQAAWVDGHVSFTDVHQYNMFYDDKAGYYLARYMSDLIRDLRNGSSKQDVLETEQAGMMLAWMDNWQWKAETEHDNLLTYLLRAWDCFSRAWDFTSAIHNAARWEVADRHLLCSLTGALAEAMYGCEYRLLKAKYGTNWYDRPDYPRNLCEGLGRIHDFQFRNRVFFPKNSALTNVERHSYVPAKTKLDGRKLTEDLRRGIMRAFYTGWDDRYGFYLDDGWIYCYRSGSILGRFRIVPADGGEWKIAEIQDCDGKNDIDIGIEEALHSAERFAG